MRFVVDGKLVNPPPKTYTCFYEACQILATMELNPNANNDTWGMYCPEHLPLIDPFTGFPFKDKE